jgi:hypothetical protein
MRFGIGMALAWLLTATGVAQAQLAVLDSLKPNQTVRVRTVGGPRFVTRLGPSAGDLFERAETPFQAGRVDSLWVRGHAVKTGAIVGAVIVTPAAFAYAAWACDFAAEGAGCNEWGKVAAFSLVAGAAGAGLGAGVGALIPKWRLRYARDREAAIGPLLGPGRLGVSVRF